MLYAFFLKDQLFKPDLWGIWGFPKVRVSLSERLRRFWVFEKWPPEKWNSSFTKTLKNGSGRALGGALVALEAPGVAGMVSLQKVIHLSAKTQEFPFFVAFTRCFWGYHSPSTAYGSVWGSPARRRGWVTDPRASKQHRQDPSAKAV